MSPREKVVTSFSPPVGKYTPSYGYVFASQSGNTKFKPLSQNNSEREPYNTFVKTCHAEAKFNHFEQEP